MLIKACTWAALITALYLLLHWFAMRSIYFPMRYPAGDWAARQRLHATDVWLTAADGIRLNGWWVEGPASGPTTLYVHGNAGNITHRESIARVINAAGSSLLLLDYRGYGRSSGSPSETGLYRDADAAYDWLIARGIPADWIIIHGESLGTAVAVDLASRRKCGGIVLASPFTSARAMAGRVLPVVGPLLAWGYDSKRKITAVRAPVLVIHGDRDEVVDYTLGKQLFDAALEPKWFWAVHGAGHNDLVESAGPAYVDHLREFYGRALRL